MLQESKRNIEDTKNRENELSEFNEAIASLNSESSKKQSVLDNLEKQEENLKQQIEGLEENILADKETLYQSGRKLDAKQNEYNLTKSMVDNLEGFPKSIRFLKKNAQWNKNAPLLSDILFCKEEYRITIKSYLENLMNYYVVQNFEEAILAINLLNNAARGKANFFVLDSSNEQNNLSVNVTQNAVGALDVVEVDKKYQKLCDYLLRNIYLVDDEAYKNLNLINSEEIILIGKSGKFFKSHHILSGGSVGLFEGKRIGKVKNLDNLLKEIKSLNIISEKLKDKIADETVKINSLKLASQNTEIQNIKKDFNLLQNELISVKTKQEQYLSFLQNTQNRKKDIEEKLINVSDLILKINPQIQYLKTQKKTKENQYQEEQIAFAELSEFLTVKSSAFNAENLKIHQQKNKLSSIDLDLEYREIQLETLENRLNKNQSDLEIAKANILETLQNTAYDDTDLIEMYQQKEELEKAVQDAEKDY